MIRIISRHLIKVDVKRTTALSSITTRNFCEKIEKTENSPTIEETSDKSEKLGGFAKAFEKYTRPVVEEQKPKLPDLPFATLLRQSKLIDLGDPKGKVVVGKIFHVVGDDLYIDFGWKFHCVCVRPQRNPDAYVRGARVKLRVKELEMSTKFLGSSKDMTLLEADCYLVGVLSSPTMPKTARTPITETPTTNVLESSA